MRPFRFLLIPLALVAAAGAAPASAETKIGSINTAQLQQAPQLKAAEIKFKAEFDKRDQDLQADKKKWQDDAKKYQRDSDSMSADQKAKAEKGLFERRQDLEQRERALSEEASQRNQELLRGASEQIGKAIEAVAKDKGLDMIVRDPAYFSPAVDITQDVLAKLASMPNEPAAGDDAGGKKKKKK